MNETLTVIKNRRSIRKYRAEQISDEELQSIMEAAIHAPNATNQQKWHFTVIQDKATLDKIVSIAKANILNSGTDFLVKMASSPDFNLFHQAPTVVMITADEKARFTEVDCGAALENIALAARALNIGSCPIGLSEFVFASEEADEIRKELGVPQGYKHVISVTLGYQEGDSPPTPPRNKDVINYIR
jgi:nitroreductase